MPHEYGDVSADLRSSEAGTYSAVWSLETEADVSIVGRELSGTARPLSSFHSGG